MYLLSKVCPCFQVFYAVRRPLMRAFVFMRQYALTHDDLAVKLKELEEKNDKQFKDVYAALQYLMTKDKIKTIEPPRKPIGFKQKNENE